MIIHLELRNIKTINNNHNHNNNNLYQSARAGTQCDTVPLRPRHLTLVNVNCFHFDRRGLEWRLHLVFLSILHSHPLHRLHGRLVQSNLQPQSHDLRGPGFHPMPGFLTKTRSQQQQLVSFTWSVLRGKMIKCLLLVVCLFTSIYCQFTLQMRYLTKIKDKKKKKILNKTRK